MLAEGGLIYINQAEWRAAENEPYSTHLDWAATWGGKYYESANAVAMYGGAIYVAGRTTSSPGSLSNIFLLKYSGDGELDWNRTWGGPSYNGCFATAADAEGVYVAGYTYTGENTNANVALLKYDFEGNLVWAKIWGGVNDALGRAIAIDKEGAVYVTGYIRGNDTTKKSFLLKYDQSGELTWNRTFGVEGVNALGVGVGNGVYVDGTNESIENNLWRSKMFLTKFDDAGNILWSREWGSNPVNDCWSISVNGGDIYQAGTTMDQSGKSSAVLRDYDPSGSLRFNVTWGNSEDKYVWGVAKNSDYIYIVGYIYKTGFSNDVLVVKFSADGTSIWNVTWGGREAESARSVATDGNDIYVSGITYSEGNDSQAFLLKYSSVNKVTSLSASWAAAAAAAVGITALTALIIRILEHKRIPPNQSHAPSL